MYSWITGLTFYNHNTQELYILLLHKYVSMLEQNGPLGMGGFTEKKKSPVLSPQK